jgi:hypothetical protein
MWRGNLVNVIKITPESAIKFFAWDAAKRFVYRNDVSQVTMVERLTAGSIAGVTAQISIFPMEVIKVRKGDFLWNLLGPSRFWSPYDSARCWLPHPLMFTHAAFPSPLDEAGNGCHRTVQKYRGLRAANHPRRRISRALSRVSEGALLFACCVSAAW